MTMTLRCGDVVPGCPAQVQADSEDEVMRQAAEHARADHGMETVDDATAARLRAAIKSG